MIIVTTTCVEVILRANYREADFHVPAVETSVTASNSPSEDYTNRDDQPTIKIDSPGSQPTTVLLRTTPTRTTNQMQTLTHAVFKPFTVFH